jgi:hypothetical protein
MKFPVLRYAVTALLLSGACSAQAADSSYSSYWYSGLGIGYSRAQFFPADFSTGGGAVESKRDYDVGFKGFLGYQINRNWAAELSFVSVGKFLYNYTNANVTQEFDYKVSGWGVSALPTIPLTSNFSLYGRLGAFFSQTRILAYNVNFQVGQSGLGPVEDEMSLLSGVGMQYFFSGDTGLRIEYENFGQVGNACTPSSTSCSGRANVKMVSANIVFKF